MANKVYGNCIYVSHKKQLTMYVDGKSIDN